MSARAKARVILASLLYLVATVAAGWGVAHVTCPELGAVAALTVWVAWMCRAQSRGSEGDR